MIKITRARYRESFTIELCFSDGTIGDYDLSSIIARDTVLTRPLTDLGFFQSFYLELGALAWPNGLEFSASAIHKTMLESGRLRSKPRLAQGA